MIDAQTYRKLIESDPAHSPYWPGSLFNLAYLAGYTRSLGLAGAEELSAELVAALRPGVHLRADQLGVSIPDELRVRIDSCTDWEQWGPLMTEFDAVVDRVRDQTG
ncbi:hypothetical protein LO763_01630 [Glycomyces sp. A-F 0318]|uniref:hypothetical protein n=1 Tax=Glycomyces amatae TaxID=2881355 RepID=UPI001E34F2B5|nr:hypothetical protein [Glycomyces amatae]MCD0442326.1 hypothetical protein [Glycomyces amatae]